MTVGSERIGNLRVYKHKQPSGISDRRSFAGLNSKHYDVGYILGDSKSIDLSHKSGEK